MIQIIIRVVPGGDHKRAFDQAVAEVGCLPGEGPFRGYSVSAGEAQNPCVPSLDWSAHGHVLGHDRRQSVWALVAKVGAWAAAEAEKAAQRGSVTELPESAARQIEALGDDLDTWLAALTVDAQPSAAQLGAAAVVGDWRWAPTDTAGLFIRGTVGGREHTTGEVVEIDRARRWVRDKDGKLWRLTPPAART